MKKRTCILPVVGLALAACGEPAPQPSFDLVFPPVRAELMTNSSPNLADLDGDGVLDIVFGTGKDRTQPEGGRYVFTREPEVPGYVIAVSGTTNQVLWKVPHPGEAFTTARFADLNRDGVADVVMGGREGAFAAYSGRDGAVLWRVAPAAVAKTPVPYGFFTPALIRDANGDGVPDLLVTYGGNDLKLPGEPRDPGFVVVVSGADGAVLAVHQTPDGKETYCSPVVYEQANGEEWVVFGTGGETDGGAAYRAPVASLLDGTFAARVERLVPPGKKGVIAPATVVELTGDGEPDLVISTFDGRLFAIDGASGRTLWEQREEGEEAYHPAAVARIARDGRLGFVVSRGIGTFPRYTGSIHRLYDAANGRLLYEHRNELQPAGAPLAVDLTGDGIDEIFFFSMRYPVGPGARIHILHARSKTLIVQDVPTNMGATPTLAAIRPEGTLELIGTSWRILPGTGTPTWRDLETQMFRADLTVKAPAFRSWAAYMGTATDGRYRPADTAKPR
ncbi:MAG TPA: hypothetical protein VIL13_08530 [Longimicrobiales bacterium]